MPVTTPEQEYERLRAYLNPYIKGPNTDAILTAIATGPSSYLVNSIAAVNDNMYIATAVGTYLDQLLAAYGITRPSAVGLSDDIFREIGIAVKNRKQVRDLINEIIDAIFGDEFVRAWNPSRAIEPYNLADGNTLIVNFDKNHTVTIPFSTDEFEDIAAATAQEVADAITQTLSSLGYSGSAVAQNDGNGNYVAIISDTIGPKSSVTVQGGSAQNVLLFDAPVAASGGNSTTQWTLSLRSGGNVRFTWSGGANPNLGYVEVGNYANVYGGGFTSSLNEGTYNITSVKGGSVNESYFEVYNPTGTAGIVTQGSDTAVLFYTPVTKNLASLTSYAAVYQTQSRVLQIFLPASTRVIRRGRIGSAHIHYPPTGAFTFNEQPAVNDQFSITADNTLVADSDFIIGATLAETMTNFIEAVDEITGYVAYLDGTNVVTIQADQAAPLLTITYTGSENIVTTAPTGDPLSTYPNQYGPYAYDLSQAFVVSATASALSVDIDDASTKIVQIADATSFPDSSGYLIFGYGTQLQEGPVPYIARPASTNLLISPNYVFKNEHVAGTDVSLVAQKSSPILSATGTDWQFYVTDVVSGREYAQALIQQIAAVGLNIVFTILYPSDIGLGKAGTIYTENPVIWGP